MRSVPSTYERLKDAGLTVSLESADQLDTYVTRLISVGKRFNLVGTLDQERVFAELIVDSLAPLPILAETGRAVDVGTGAGLPGLPLAIVLPKWHFTLVEPRLKRIRFVAATVRLLGLKNVSVVRGRLEDGVIVGLEEAYTGELGFDLAMSKAVFSPESWPTLCAGVLKTGGCALIYTQGGLDDARSVLNEPDRQRITQHRTYVVPQRGRRTVLLVE